MREASKRHEALIFLALTAIGALVAFFGPTYYANLAVWVATSAALAASFRFLMLIGEVNMGLAAFYGAGAYGSAIATVFWHAPFLASLLVGVAAALALSIAFGFATMRIKGPYFMLVGFGFSEMIRLLISRMNAVGGNSGIVGIVADWPGTSLLGVNVIVLAIAVGIMVVVEKSPQGKIFDAIKQNEAAAQSVGIEVLHKKVLCLVIAAGVAGLVGVFSAHVHSVVTPQEFSFYIPIFAMAAVKLGGEKTYIGPVLGAMFLTLVAHYVADYGQLESMFYGAAIIVALLALPDGFAGVLERVGIIGLRARPASPAKRGH